MGSRSKIEWTESTWNPVTGCSPVTERLRLMGQKKYVDGFEVRMHASELRRPVS